MNKNEAEKVIKDTIVYANNEIRKTRKKYLTILISMFVIFALLFSGYCAVFKYEFAVDYKENLVSVYIPEDQGVDIKINLEKYQGVNAVLVNTDENGYDLYINITQTIASRLLKDSDPSDNLLRVGNNMIVDYQSETVRAFIPNGVSAESIRRIYYMDDLSDQDMVLNNEELDKNSNKVLVWERTS